MEKILNSRLFLVLICGIIFTSVGVGATNYVANQIAYKDGTSVESSLNDLYSATEIMNYSEEETVVGKWINGKPIYRKYFQYSEALKQGYNDLYDVSNLDADEIIKVGECKAHYNAGAHQGEATLPYVAPTEMAVTVPLPWYAEWSNKISVNLSTYASRWSNVRCFIYYTKK